MAPERLALLHEPTEVRVELGCAACDVDHGNIGGLQRRHRQLRDLSRHHFATVRAGIDVTMPARLVAQLPDVELKDRGAGPRPMGTSQRREEAAALRIWIPCTSAAPPRIAAATWTATVICSRFD